jgi:hypothetical protein
MNSHRNSSTGITPYILLFERQLNPDIRQYEELPPFRKEIEEGTVPSTVYYGKELDQLTNGIEAMRQVANQVSNSEAIHKREISFEGGLQPLVEGDYVIKFVHGALLTKVMPRWSGPYKVAIVLDDDSYPLQSLVQDYNERDDTRRHEFIKVICRDDQQAIAEHQKDSFELTPTKVISHTGNAD